MTDYTAVRACSGSLLTLFREHITLTAEPGLTGVPVDLRSPRELEQANVDTTVSIWLYRLVVHPDKINHQNTRPAPGIENRRPLSVELSYLVTPLHPSPLDELTLLGRSAQIVHDHPRLAGSQLTGSLAGTPTVLRLSLDITGVQDANNLWWSLQSQHRAAVGFHVEGVVIESHRPPAGGPPVLTRRADTTQILSAS